MSTARVFNPHDPLNLGRCLQNVLAVTLVELVKVLQLGWKEWQVVCGQRNTSTHHSQLSLKVLHHVAQEVISHLMELLVFYLVLDSTFKFVAHGDHQAVHGTDLFDLQVFDFA